jgi:hypothetical protein
VHEAAFVASTLRSREAPPPRLQKTAAFILTQIGVEVVSASPTGVVMSTNSGISKSARAQRFAGARTCWFRLNAHTLLLVLVLAGGWIANFATLSARMTDVEKTQGKMDQRFDRDVVPRPEQEVRERMLDQRLAQMQRTLDAIQQELERQRK